MSLVLTVNGSTYDYPETGDLNWGPDATDWAQAVTVGMLQKAGGLFQLLSETDFGTSYGLKSLYYKSRTANPAAAGQIRLGNTDNISWRNAANSADLPLSVDASNQLTFNSVAIVNSSGNFLDSTFRIVDNGDATKKLAFEVSGVSTGTTRTITMIDANVTIVGTTNTQTLTNKTLTNPVIGFISNTGLLTLPTDTTVLVGRSTGDTLTNKAMSGSDNTFTNIPYSALILTGSIVNADISASAAIANSKMANMAESTIKGRAASSGTGAPVDLTATQATAILNNFVGDSGAGGTKGLVPAPAAGDAAALKFLKADGTWAQPAGSGDVTGPASAVDGLAAVYNGSTGKIIKTFVPTAGSIVFAGTGGILEQNNSRLFFDNSGFQLRLGDNTDRSIGLNEKLQVNASAQHGGAVFTAWSTTAGHGPALSFAHSKSNTIGTQSIVADGDNLGRITFYGSDGTAFIAGARITSQVDGTPGTNDMPGRLLFETTPDGAAAALERMRIDSNGNVGIGVLAPTSKLHAVNASAGVTAALITGYSGAQIYVDYLGGASNFYEASLHSFRNLVGSEAMRINSSQQVLVATTTSVDTFNGTVSLQVGGTSAVTRYTSVNNAGQVHSRYDNNDIVAPLTISNLTIAGTTQGVGLFAKLSSETSTQYPGGNIQWVSENATYTSTTSTQDSACRISNVLNGTETVVCRFRSAGGIDVGIVTVPDNISRIHNTSTTNYTLGVRNVSTDTGSDAIPAIQITKGSTTNTAGSNHFIDFYINAGATGSGAIASNGASAAAFFTLSDRRLKRDIKPLESALDLIGKLNPVTFKWANAKEDKDSVGFIAQEFAEVLPEAVMKTDDGKSDEMPKKKRNIEVGDDFKTVEIDDPWMMSDSGLIPYLVQAIKELKAEIEVLKQRGI